MKNDKLLSAAKDVLELKWEMFKETAYPKEINWFKRSFLSPSFSALFDAVKEISPDWNVEK